MPTDYLSPKTLRLLALTTSCAAFVTVGGLFLQGSKTSAPHHYEPVSYPFSLTPSFLCDVAQSTHHLFFSLGTLKNIPFLSPKPTPPINPAEKQITYNVTTGDTLVSILQKVGLSKDEAYRVIGTLQDLFNPRAFKVGQPLRLHLRYDPQARSYQLLSLHFDTPSGNEVWVKRHKNGLKAEKKVLPLFREITYIEGIVTQDFYRSVLQQGAPKGLIKKAVTALSYDINWQHDPKPGDKFTLAYEIFKNHKGQVVKTGDLVYAAFAPKGIERRVYLFQGEHDAKPAYYNEQGESVTKTLLQTPLKPSFMNVSSKFGLRNHPVHGYTKMHKGVDFRAPYGTPVMAAGNGVVVKACYYGAYGNYVLIKHNQDYATAYAHLSKISVKVGDRVSQHQVIGAVGATGRATGPHLHHEVIYKGRHINPQTVQALPGKPLSKKDMARFTSLKASLSAKMFKKIPSLEYATTNLPPLG